MIEPSVPAAAGSDASCIQAHAHVRTAPPATFVPSAVHEVGWARSRLGRALEAHGDRRVPEVDL